MFNLHIRDAVYSYDRTRIPSQRIWEIWFTDGRMILLWERK